MSQVLRKFPQPKRKPETLAEALQNLGVAVENFKRVILGEVRYYRRSVRKMFDADQRRLRMEKPLRDYLEPIHRRMDREGVPLDERSVILGKKRWPKQYKAGLKRFWGIDIEWVSGHV